MTHTLELKGLKLILDGVYISIILDEEILAKEVPVFLFRSEFSGEIAHDQWKAQITEAQMGEVGLISAEYACDIFRIRVDLSKEKENMRIAYTQSAVWPEVPLRTELHLPWLSSMKLENAEIRYPANPVPKGDGSSAMQLNEAYALPYFMAKECGRGVAVRFDVPAARLDAWNQLRNCEMMKISSCAELKQHAMHPRIHSIPALTCEALIEPLTGGWPEAFENVRNGIRARMNFSEYSRPDLKWIDRAPIQHFTYVYGSEVCDYDAEDEHIVNIDRLLDAGEAFGGYDCVILWHQYPRLGLDQRSQWVFFEEFPGGIPALKRVVERAHCRGVKVILPFKPWDRAPQDTDDDTTRAICRIIEQTDIDGIFFDTMNTVPLSFRRAIDAVKSGVVFITECEIGTREAIEGITSSWDQYWNDISMPESTLSRFLFPEHRRHAIARWHMGAQKDMAIERAVFQGMPMVIWQDIFGAWLPYAAVQKEKIARWKKLYLEFEETLNSSGSIPLIKTKCKDVYANFFPGKDCFILTLYNEAKIAVKGELVDMKLLPGLNGEKRFVRDHWMGKAFSVEEQGLFGEIGPGECCFIELHR